MKKNLLLSIFSFSVLVLTSCKKEPENPTDLIPNTLNQLGVFVVNEGNFGMGNASIDFIYRDSAKIVKDLFTSANGRSIGDVAQSMAIFNQKGYIVLNNSGKIEVVDMNDFKSTGAITGLTSPRYFIGVNATKGYVTDWTSNTVKIINLETNQVQGSINTGLGPEQMLMVGNRVFVANSGGFGLDSTITIINTENDQVLETIRIGDAPQSLKQDLNGKVWILCRGDYGDFSTISDDSKGKLVRLNPNTYTVEAEFLIGNIGNHPDKLAISKDKDLLYYTSFYGSGLGIFKFGITDNTLPTAAFITGNFYGLGVDPLSGLIYAADAKDYNQNGTMYRFNPSTGLKTDSFTVGVIPNGIGQ